MELQEIKIVEAAPEMFELLKLAYDRFTDNDMMPPNSLLKKWLKQAESIFEYINNK